MLALIVWAEMRGNPDTSAFGRTIPGGSQRQAVTITAAAMAAVFLAVSALLAVNDLPLEDVLFEAFSAFGTVGLSTGVTPLLDETGRAVIVGLMFLGRLGPAHPGDGPVVQHAAAQISPGRGAAAHRMTGDDRYSVPDHRGGT